MILNLISSFLTFIQLITFSAYLHVKMHLILLFKEYFNMKYTTLLLDFDDTLVDFDDAEEQAFFNMAQNYQSSPTYDDFTLFKKINQAHWEAFQNNQLSKEDVLSQRFIKYFKHHNITVNGHEADECFRDELAKVPVKYFNDTLATLAQLRQHCSLYIVTNGVAITQQRRIAQTPFDDLFEGIFISEHTGYQKPMSGFFDYVFNHIKPTARSTAMIIGDSLTSDILGGHNANIATCWFNYRNKTNSTAIKPDFEIRTLAELLPIIQST